MAPIVHATTTNTNELPPLRSPPLKEWTEPLPSLREIFPDNFPRTPFQPWVGPPLSPEELGRWALREQRASGSSSATASATASPRAPVWPDLEAAEGEQIVMPPLPDYPEEVIIRTGDDFEVVELPLPLQSKESPKANGSDPEALGDGPEASSS